MRAHCRGAVLRVLLESDAGSQEVACRRALAGEDKVRTTDPARHVELLLHNCHMDRESTTALPVAR
jgi:hypothetical protein